MIVRNYIRSFVSIFILTLSLNSLADGASPTSQVKSTVNGILDVLSEKSLTTDARREKIHKLLNSRFYFRAMSQRTLARNWKKATTEQQKEFIGLFSDLLRNTYVGRIEAYTDQRIEYLREKIKNAKRSIVYTQIVTSSADIPITYKLAKKGNEWLIYDVIIEKVSLISNYRSSYASIIKREGMDHLLEKMKEKLKTADAS
ncbi:MAG: ABC transporter substrate-binding protein [Gammaproteobacteria bacterium]|nr:ABC transporter substrate-binding protein [Gammaproteobacteria bacterium]